MPKSKQRKNHKQKLAARQNKIGQQKSRYNKFMQEQMAMIEEQMKNQQARQINVANEMIDITKTQPSILIPSDVHIDKIIE